MPLGVPKRDKERLDMYFTHPYTFTLHMNYELAKQLKDAGFPQSKYCDHCGTDFGDKYEPTLSELIEECGDDISYLEKKVNGWMVSNSMGLVEVVAPTPEEAVAKLWLKLGK